VVIVEMVKEFADEEAFVFGVRKGFSDYGDMPSTSNQ
jgi:hypothetical protein